MESGIAVVFDIERNDFHFETFGRLEIPESTEMEIGRYALSQFNSGSYYGALLEIFTGVYGVDLIRQINDELMYQ